MILQNNVLLLVFLFLINIFGCSEPVEESTVQKLPPVKVRIETLAPEAAPSQIEVVGTLQAVERATISARVAGQVVELPVQVGAKVNRGDLLVRLSAAEINARVQQAEIQLEQARRNLERESKLLEVDAATRESVRTLEEQVQTSEAALREARTILGYTEIKAPFTGTVTDKQVEIGDLASPGTALLKLENGTALEVVFQVPETQAQALNLSSRLPMTIPTAGLKLEAQVREISPTVDPASRTTRVKLMLPDATGLRSGQFARVVLDGHRPTTLLVERSALRQNGQMQQVFVVEEDMARMRLVRTGAEIDGRIEILSGLRDGDRVILEPPANLRDGQPLVIMDGREQ